MEEPKFEPNHTPGLWRAVWLDDGNAWVMDAGDNYLATLVTEDGEGKCADGNAQVFNLELMAAAPLMLAELVRLRGIFDAIGMPQTELDEVMAIAAGNRLAPIPPYTRTISWCTGDVYKEALGIGYRLDNTACREILDEVVDSHDASEGVSWQDFSLAIGCYAERNNLECDEDAEDEYKDL